MPPTEPSVDFAFGVPPPPTFDFDPDNDAGALGIPPPPSDSADTTLPGALSTSLHLEGLAGDWRFDTSGGMANAWAMGRALGLHGYKKPSALVIHWQARPAKRTRT